jgi:phosphomannomutase
VDREVSGFPVVDGLGALDGVKVAIDCGNGAAYRNWRRRLFRRLGAEVVPIGASRTAAISI